MIEASASNEAAEDVLGKVLDRLGSPIHELRALALGPERGPALALLDERAVGEVLICGGDESGGDAATSTRQRVPAWTQIDREVHGTFGLVCCGDALAAESNPMGLLGRLWTVTERDSALVLHGRVTTDPRLSQYVALTGEGDRRGWLPGRLVLRWMVETSGFRVESMFDAPSALGREPVASCALLARRVDRRPVLV